MATYEISVVNQATYPGSICVYLTCPDSQQVQRDLQSLAWFVQKVNTGTNAQFDWDLEYAFAWAQTGKLEHGVRFKVAESLAADPTDNTGKKNRVLFDKNDFGYFFDKEKPESAPVPPDGALNIQCGLNVADYEASIGIGIKGTAALAVQARPNLAFTFIPHFRYWIAFGNFTPGTVIDANQMTPPFEIVFPNNVYTRTLKLGSNNTWQSGDQYH